jgi:hypothetical protein
MALCACDAVGAHVSPPNISAPNISPPSKMAPAVDRPRSDALRCIDRLWRSFPVCSSDRTRAMSTCRAMGMNVSD